MNRRRLLLVLASLLLMLAAACSAGGSSGSDAGDSDAGLEPDGAARSAPLAAVAGVNASGAGQATGGQIPDDNVVGGTAGEIEQFPWTVALIRPGRTDNFCGGVLISPTRVLTAAHCVQEVERDRDGNPVGTAYLAGPGLISVVTGRTELDEAGGQEIKVSRVWQAAGYDNRALSTDYALLDLAEPATQTAIALPRNTDTGLWKPGVRAWAAGWGCQKPNTKPLEACEDSGGSPLEYTTMATTDGSPCEREMGDFDDATGLCLVSELKESATCQGDSGGPYIVRGNNDVWYVVGVVSYGPIGCPPGEPEVGAHVKFLVDGSGQLLNLEGFTCEDARLCSYPD
jgi:secreted trypsin-like serine protease